MKIIKRVRIDKSSAEVWKVAGEEFDQAYLWMSFVKHSFALDNKNAPSFSPVGGRVCRFGNDEKSAYAEEEITAFDPVSRTLTFNVYPKNTPAILPVRSNEVTIQVVSLGENQSEVIWTAIPEIKPWALLFTPLLKLAFGKGFKDVLKELKDYCEKRDFQLSTVQAAG